MPIYLFIYFEDHVITADVEPKGCFFILFLLTIFDIMNVYFLDTALKSIRPQDLAILVLLTLHTNKSAAGQESRITRMLWNFDLKQGGIDCC